jgi:hypothetical protein
VTPSDYVVVLHAAADADYAGRLVAHLGSRGIAASPVSDERADAQWQLETSARIGASAAVVVLESAASETSVWVLRGIEYARLHARPVLPLSLDGKRLIAPVNLQIEDVSSGAMPSSRFVDALRRHLPEPPAQPSTPPMPPEASKPPRPAGAQGAWRQAGALSVAGLLVVALAAAVTALWPTFHQPLVAATGPGPTPTPTPTVTLVSGKECLIGTWALSSRPIAGSGFSGLVDLIFVFADKTGTVTVTFSGTLQQTIPTVSPGLPLPGLPSKFTFPPTTVRFSYAVTADELALTYSAAPPGSTMYESTLALVVASSDFPWPAPSGQPSATAAAKPHHGYRCSGDSLDLLDKPNGATVLSFTRT